MKKRFFYGALGLLTLGAFAACSSEENQLKNGEELMMEYQMSVNISDLDTRSGEPTPPSWEVDPSDPANIKDCPEISAVKDMVDAKYLYANVDVTYGNHPKGLANETFVLKLEKFGDQLIMEPMILPLGTHQITGVEIMHNNGTTGDTSDDKMIFAGVGKTSKYKNFVPSEHLLPRCIELTEEDYKYQKVEDPMTVLCAVNAQAEDFGFIKWNTNFVKVYCIPFLVNKCDVTNGHTVASTRVEVYQRGADGKPVQTPIYISDMQGATGMNTFCISDDMKVADKDEYYFIKIFDVATSELIDVYEGTVTDLKDPKNHPNWDEVYEFIHYTIDQCTGCEGYPEATTWAGETFKDKDIAKLLEDGWKNLVYSEHYGWPTGDYINNGNLYIKRTFCNRYVFTPVFYIAKAGKFCVNYPSDYSDEKVSISVESANVATYVGGNDDAYLFGGKPHDCGSSKDCVEICEPGCYRIKITVKGSIIGSFAHPISLKDVTLTRMDSCNENPR